MLRFYIPKDTTVFVTILDEWGRRITNRLRNFGYKVEVLWEKNEKHISSTMIRRCIVGGRDWRQLVPDAAYRYVIDHEIDLRIREQ